MYEVSEPVYPSTTLKMDKKHKHPALYLACDIGDDEIGSLLVDRSPGLNTTEKHGAQLVALAHAKQLVKVSAALARLSGTSSSPQKKKSSVGKKAGSSPTKTAGNPAAAQLWTACEAGDVDAVKLLVSDNADVNSTGLSGDSLLLSALKRNDGNMVLNLIAQGADVSKLHVSGMSPGDQVIVNNDGSEYKKAFRAAFGTHTKGQARLCGKKGEVLSLFKQNAAWVTKLLLDDGTETDPDSFQQIVEIAAKSDANVVRILPSTLPLNLTTHAPLLNLGPSTAYKRQLLLKR